jgi:hypothetical protein
MLRRQGRESTAGRLTITQSGRPGFGERPGHPWVWKRYRKLRYRGASFRVEPRLVTGDRLAADFRDPDGHVLSIFGPRKGGPA